MFQANKPDKQDSTLLKLIPSLSSIVSRFKALTFYFIYAICHGVSTALSVFISLKQPTTLFGTQWYFTLNALM